MRETLLDVAHRHHFEEIQEDLQGIDGRVVLNVGFLGEFSSGKSTLINALLDKKVLPAMVKPTTGAIIELEPRDDLEQMQRFERGADGELTELSASDFSDLALGKRDGTGVLVVRSSDILREGYRVIDTPGLASLEATHTDITFGYLPFLDGAVICVSLERGGIPKSVFDFLARPEVRPLARHFIFALTFADQKDEESAQRILAEVVSQVADFAQVNGLDLPEPARRVVPVSAQKALDGEGAFTLDAFKQAFDTYFLRAKENLHAERVSKELTTLGGRLAELLDDRLQNFKLSVDEYKEKEQAIKQDEVRLNQSRKAEESRLENSCSELRSQLQQLNGRYKDLFSNSSQEQLDELTQRYTAELTACVELNVSRFCEGVSLPGLTYAGEQVATRVRRVIKHAEFGKTISTAIIFAAISGGAGLLGNAAEMGGAGAARVAAARLAAGAAGKAAKAGAVLLRGIGKVIQQVNPVEYVGDLVAQPFKNQSAESALQDIAESVLTQVRLQLSDVFEREVFRPLEEQCAEVHRSLERVREEKARDLEEQVAAKQQIEEDLRSVRDLLRT
jgi:GTPase SAR1 family protein